MDCLQRVLEVPKRGRMTAGDIVVGSKRRHVAFLHRIHDRLDVAGPERDVVGHACGAVGVEVDRGGRRAARGLGPQRRVLELKEGLDVEIFLRCSQAAATPHAAHRF